VLEARGSLLVWWTSQQDLEWYATKYDVEEPPPYPDWPEYLLRELRSRFGRNGRGRLWVASDSGFGDVSISPWPNTPLAAWAEKCAGGIVIRAEDLPLFRDVPGVITDLRMRQVDPVLPSPLSPQVP
jgi:hypothetical protein